MSEQPAEPISMPMMGAGRLERSCEPEVPEPHSDRGVGELMTRFSNSMPSRGSGSSLRQRRRNQRRNDRTGAQNDARVERVGAIEAASRRSRRQGRRWQCTEVHAIDQINSHPSPSSSFTIFERQLTEIGVREASLQRRQVQWMVLVVEVVVMADHRLAAAIAHLTADADAQQLLRRCSESEEWNGSGRFRFHFLLQCLEVSSSSSEGGGKGGNGFFFSVLLFGERYDARTGNPK
ncbi:hypothetical protein TYRP_006759 [Tyrophagus putrescentiae]|nr:hypothetical protein TYRP_006759 [Tyrophagus putrescentiae]